MESAEQSRLLRRLHARREVIADRWYQALAGTSFTPFSAVEVRAQLVTLTDHAIAGLLAEPFERDPVRAIGAALVRLHYVHHEALGRTQAVLAQQLVEGLPSRYIVKLQPCLVALLSEIAAGFFKAARSAMLREQEEARRAVLAERDAISAELLRNEERLRTILTNVPLILFATDQEGVITLVEGKGLQALNMTPHDVIEQSVFDVTPTLSHVDVPRILSRFRRALAGEAFTVVGQVAGRQFETRYAPLRNEQNAIIGVIGVAVDITERARVEMELGHVRRRLGELQERERLRLAADLHDDAVQHLLGIALRLDSLEQRVRARQDADDDAVAPDLAAVRAAVLGVEAHLRTVISELHPPGLVDLGLAATLRGYVARVQREGGAGLPVIALDLDDCGTTLPMPVADTLFRVAREALRNALRHAGARHLTLRLHRRAHEVGLSVRDDGCGFEPATPLSKLLRTNHFGLVSMADRVAWVNGHLTIHAQPGRGTEIVVRIPLPDMEVNDE